jgi:antitoxin YefM
VNLWQETRLAVRHRHQENARRCLRLKLNSRHYNFAASFWCIVSGLRCRGEIGVGRLGEASLPDIAHAGARSLDFQGHGQYPVHVKSITYSAARENLASTINRVCEDQAPVVITRNRDQAVVMLSLAEYESLQETAYLLRSPANARRLLAAVDTLKRGKGIKRKIKLGP